MKRISSLLVLIGVLAFSGPPTTVVLNLTSQDCFAGSPDPIPGVTVSAFKLSHAQKLLTQLKTMDQATFADGDTLAMSRFDVQYSDMLRLVNKTHALGRGTSGADGTLNLSFTAVDSVLVVGYEELEDVPYYYSYAVLPGSSSGSFVLDMSRGSCAN